MPSRHLPAFNFENVVSANTARQDKIEIAIQHGTITDAAGDVELFLNFLGSPPADHEHPPAAFGRIFTRRLRGVPPFSNQIIRQRATTNQPHPAPLFDGSLHIPSVQGMDSTWRLWSLLSLNPTRFIRHQQFPNPNKRLLRENPHFEYGFYQADIPAYHGDEFALIESDNWIPDERLWSLFTSPRFWQRHLRSFLAGAVTEVHDDLLRAAELVNVRIERRGTENPYSLYSVETYWEFFSDDPIGTVLALQPWLEEFAAAPVDARDYPLHVRLERHENSRRLSVQTRTGETLKIYAKTNRRVRFEITHLLSGQSPFRLATGGHTFSTIEGIFPLLTRLATVAAERVNEVLHHFRLNASTPDGQHTVLAFIANIQAACGNPDTARELLQILTNNGSLVVGPGIPLGIVFRAELERLVRRGILRRSNRRYSVTPSYRQALMDMQERGIGFLLGVRIRRRNQ